MGKNTPCQRNAKKKRPVRHKRQFRIQSTCCSGTSFQVLSRRGVRFAQKNSPAQIENLGDQARPESDVLSNRFSSKVAAKVFDWL